MKKKLPSYCDYKTSIHTRVFKLLCFLLFIPFFGSTQKSNHSITIDSLHSLLWKSEELHFKEYRIKESLEYAVLGANYAHKLKDNESISFAYFLMALNYETITDYKTAKSYYLKALNYISSTKNSIQLASIYNGLGSVYNAGDNNLKRSLMYYNMSKEILKINDYPEGYLTPLINIGWLYLDLNEFDKAYPFLIESERLVKIINDIRGSCEVNYLKGRYFFGKNNINLAKKNFAKAIVVGQENNFIEELSLIYKVRSEMYESIGDTNNAYIDIKAYNDYQNKFYDKEKLKQIEVAKASFHMDEYERELEIAKKERNYQTVLAKNNRTINIVSFAGLIFLLGAVFFFYRGYKSKKRNNNVLQEKNKELLEAKLEAEKLTRIKSQFISTVSHELRTPLHGVIGITSLLLEEKEILEKHKKLLGSLKFSGDYLLNLINNVLKISKIESNKIELQKTPINLYQLCQNLINSFEYQAKSKGNELILIADPILPDQLNIDSLRLSEILINLIGNASKFTEHGKIWLKIKVISIENNEAHIQFAIEDTGVGIPEDKKEYIFEKFSQINREHSELDGTGLGLSIVKKLLDIMGSTIVLEGKEGEGAKFLFDLKLEIVKENTQDSSAERDETTLTVQKNILIVEDNRINQIVTRNLLSLIGYNCTVVENGLMAIQIVENESFDLILMDLNMPFLSGNEATKLIRKFDKKTPIVALTASDIEEVKEECLKVGMNDFINKPFNKNDLSDVIAKNLS